MGNWQCLLLVVRLQEVHVPSGDEIKQLHAPKSPEVSEYWVGSYVYC